MAGRFRSVTQQYLFGNFLIVPLDHRQNSAVGILETQKRKNVSGIIDIRLVQSDQLIAGFDSRFSSPSTKHFIKNHASGILGYADT